jgi:hypothetical protein
MVSCGPFLIDYNNLQNAREGCIVLIVVLLVGFS